MKQKRMQTLTGVSDHVLGAAHIWRSVLIAAALALLLLVTAGGMSAARAADPLADEAAAAVWTGAGLVTTAVDQGGNLYAYVQAAGTKGWKHELVESKSANGGAEFENPSIASTGTAVQIVAIDVKGRIWFWQQSDSGMTWSPPVEVGVLGAPGFARPEVAWTGVLGHAGTNSVVTVSNAAGNVLFFWQDGSRWHLETVARGSATNLYFDPKLTATDKGIVIVAPSTDGVFASFFQPYGGTRWISDGAVGVPAGASFGDLSVTWDGVNVDVAAQYSDGSAGRLDNQVRFLWKADSAQFWTQESIPGVSSDGVGAPAIYHTAGNLIIAAVVAAPSTSLQLDYWFQTTSFKVFAGPQTVATAPVPALLGEPALVSTTGSGAEVAIFDQESTDQISFGLYQWTQPVGTSDPWLPHTVDQP